MINSEQIQALKAAIDDATQGSWVNESGEGWEAICCDDDQEMQASLSLNFRARMQQQTENICRLPTQPLSAPCWQSVTLIRR
jgi:hypothetical protein